MLYPVRRVWRPAIYQGGHTARRYFEGWYFKQVDAAGAHVLSVIPGVSFSADGANKHAFVQVVPGGGEAHYFAYPVESFSFERERFGVRIADNVFSEQGITLRLADDTAEVHGDLGFGAWMPWPVTALSPGVMGPFRFAPRMETYHGVLSMDHAVTGSLAVNGTLLDFEGGRGYTEKDWGRSFPSAWIWTQSNTFDRPGVSVVASIAKIPWMTRSFVGNIAGLLLDGSLHRFATYTGARLACLDVDGATAHLVLRDRHEELDVVAHGGATVLLKAPTLGSMDARDAESLGGTIDVTLRELHGGSARVVFRGTGRQAGVEIMDERGELTPASCEDAPAAG